MIEISYRINAKNGGSFRVTRHETSFLSGIMWAVYVDKMKDLPYTISHVEMRRI